MKTILADPLMFFELAMIYYEEGVHPSELLLCCGEQGYKPLIKI